MVMGQGAVAARRHSGQLRIAAAFFLSGAAALIDQVAWQRLLFVVVGVDIESVTIVVSTFMLGLGLGALLGGALADAWPQRIALMFALAETGIGLFGLASADLILTLGQNLGGLSRPAVAAASFTLLLLPTMAMGATLPMLVADAFRATRNIGVATGTLYFVNTLGAALGAAAVGLVLLYWMDLRDTLRVAAALNGMAALAVFSVRRAP